VKAEFERLAHTRARRRARRRRQVVVTVGLGLVATAAVLGPWAGPGEGHGQADGRVEMIEPETSTIRVSAGFLGLRSIPIVLTSETIIVVGDKEGGFGDIRQGERVVAAYEVRPGVLQARRVEVFPSLKAAN